MCKKHAVDRYSGIGFSLVRLLWQSLTKNKNPTVYNMVVIMLAYVPTFVPA